MKGNIGRIIALVAAGSLLAVGTAGMASASPVGGKGSSATEAVGAQVLQMRDDLTKVAYAGKVGMTRADLDKLSPVLADLAAGKRYTIQSETQQLSSAAQLRADESNRLLGDPTATARQLPPLPIPVPTLPDLPGPLKIVSDLVKALLAAVTGILGGLLGAVPPLPVPLPPVPGVPPLPVPAPAV
ncbi:hypothetical protein OG943_34135 [Amycolatopsis sp. NBC_00345]|uniref:hypothetical protein n=1 Tax=Amycolatopsis sp. NBC_00345 TaxID=2975955 RepID=UPI002E263A9D